MIKRLHLIGCGGTGSWLAEPLVKLLTYHNNVDLRQICLYDGDVYEESNLTRQLFPASYLGQNKAVVTKSRLVTSGVAIAIEVYGEYINEDLMLHYLNRHWEPGADLVVVAIDNEHGRHDIINALTKYNGDFICLLPGNEFRTATAIWFGKNNGEIYPLHPFDFADNYANPSDKPRGNCAYEVISSPQLINANFASALLCLELTYALINGGSLPFCVSYNGEQFTQSFDGKLTQYALQSS
jgi:hypothetical protein